MADGVASAQANTLLSDLTSVMSYVALHTGDPGTAGTSNASSVTTRQAVTWGSASAGSISASNVPTWTSWAGTNGETDTDISFWSAATGGTFEDSITLTAPITVDTGDTVEITSITVSIPTAS